MFQSLTRDSNHSNRSAKQAAQAPLGFNPSRGIAIIQTKRTRRQRLCSGRFNPSRGIAIIQTLCVAGAFWVERAFQSLTRDSNHSNPMSTPSAHGPFGSFQSLTRDSNHSNSTTGAPAAFCSTFQSLTRDSNHSNGGARARRARRRLLFQSLTRDSNHSNNQHTKRPAARISFQSLTRDSNHSNFDHVLRRTSFDASFNPSRGIAIIQTCSWAR